MCDSITWTTPTPLPLVSNNGLPSLYDRVDISTPWIEISYGFDINKKCISKKMNRHFLNYVPLKFIKDKRYKKTKYKKIYDTIILIIQNKLKREYINLTLKCIERMYDSKLYQLRHKIRHKKLK